MFNTRNYITNVLQNQTNIRKIIKDFKNYKNETSTKIFFCRFNNHVTTRQSFYTLTHKPVVHNFCRAYRILMVMKHVNRAIKMCSIILPLVETPDDES